MLRVSRQINLAANRLCGAWEQQGNRNGSYDATVLKAMCDALASGPVKAIDLSVNFLGVEGGQAIARAISKGSLLQVLVSKMLP